MDAVLNRVWSGTQVASASSDQFEAPERVSILVTVGTEFPFDRLVAPVDTWTDAHDCEHDVVARTGAQGTPPEHARWTRILDYSEFTKLLKRAELIFAHAGMGTILAALKGRRPLLVLARRSVLGEHRNDHQFATVAMLTELDLVIFSIARHVWPYSSLR